MLLRLGVIACLFFNGCNSKKAEEVDTRYTSQYAQDRYVNDRFFHNKREGVFVDIGASDGVTGSNSYFFEKELGWRGICVEPIPSSFAKLEKARSCRLVHGAVSDRPGTASFLYVEDIPELSGLVATYHPRHLERVGRELAEIEGTMSTMEVPCFCLGDLLDEEGITHVDFLSLDTEGSELAILKSIDFDRFSIDVIAVENNYHNPEYHSFLASKGYRLITRLACDELYTKQY